MPILVSRYDRSTLSTIKYIAGTIELLCIPNMNHYIILITMYIKSQPYNIMSKDRVSP